jgi:predicted metal-dependent phosphoesterase TrpH
MIKADLHMHSKEDIHDVIDYTSFELIDRAAELGFGLISITLHDHFPDYSEIEQYADKRGIIFIWGVEKIISGKEVLVYNLTAEDFQGLNTFDDLRKLKMNNKDILVIAPHPYFKIDKCLGEDLEKHIELFDAIEVSWFYSDHINMNKKAIEVAKRYSKPLFATSDAHELHQFGKNYTLVDAKKDKKELTAAIKSGKVILHSYSISSLSMIFNGFKLVIGGSLKRFRKNMMR